MKIETPTDLLFDQLRDIHSFEALLVDEFQDLARFATSPGLKDLLSGQAAQTGKQRMGIAKIFAVHEQELGRDPCKAMEGLLKGGRKHIKQAKPGTVRDLLIIAHSLRVKNYEIAAYRFSVALADCLEYSPIVETLRGYLEVEEAGERCFHQEAANIYQPCMLENVR